MRGPRYSVALIFVCTSALFASCGEGASVHGIDATVPDGGFCGTHANPGILKLENLEPPMGATVANQNIVHGFTVVNAPAEFSHFDLRFGSTHTAGLPNPESPTFTVVIDGSNVLYQLTIFAWSRSPAHVEMAASAGYDTSAGCAWVFPSPLFSYDIVGGPDGGTLPEPAGTLDGASVRIDAALDGATEPVDAPLEGADVVLDATLDGAGPPDLPERFDVTTTEASLGVDLATAWDSGVD
jgi:hypothetical protein